MDRYTQLTATDKAHWQVADHADLDLGTGDIFLTASVKRDSLGSQAIASKYEDGPNHWILYFDSSHKIRFYAKVANVYELDLHTTNAFSATGTDYHIAVLVDRTNSANNRIYVNGVSESLATSTSSSTDVSNAGATSRIDW